MKIRNQKLSIISSLHYLKLFYRSFLFIWAMIVYIVNTMRDSSEVVSGFEKEYWLLGIIWISYMVEMICRLFPSRFESMGCQKQFRRNYRPTGEEEPKLQSWKGTFFVAVAWVLLNGLIGVLYYRNSIDEGILTLISLAYGICDMICILFFCPFQTWFMKNRCCTVCRIYNWDFAMMFTPFLFIPTTYTWSLLGVSLLILLRWELTLHFYPERFSERTNECLSCKNCEEKLCHHKKQLKGFWKKIN